MKIQIRPVLATLGLLSTLSLQPATVFAQGTAFTYQGRLASGTNAAAGIYDLRFTVYDSSGGPGVVAGPVTNSPTAVSNGLFTVTLDFGAGIFTGAERWLEIGVRTNGGGAFSTLSPRQKITPTPYAITSGNLSGTLPAGQVSGNLNAAVLPTGGNWPLSSTLTLDGTTLAIDPINNRVGIGTSTPATALTVATGVGYGIEHTDGTRRLSTYLDEGGCWLGSVSADKLNFFVNNGLSSLTLDLAGRVGIGTTAPAWPLHVVAGQSAARLDSTANTFGSVLELRNNTASPTTLGAINFNNAAATYPGQIAYTGTDALTFRTAGTERMRLDSSGRLDVFGSLLQLINTTPFASNIAALVMQGDTADQSATLRLERVNSAPLLRLLLGSAEVANISGDNGNAVRFKEDVHFEQGITATAIFPPLLLSRTGSDGNLVLFQRDYSVKGSISVAGDTVSYNAFTGSHYAWTDLALHRGQLVRMTGVNRRFGARPAGEIIYGIARTTRANDPACLGAYLVLQEPAQPAGDTNPHLVMAVGNGELWVVESGGDLEPGDCLIASEVEGCAMKDDPARFAIGHVVARAAERVAWSEVPPDANGLKRRLISVLFAPFVRGAAGDDRVTLAAVQALNQDVEQLSGELKRRDAENAELKQRLEKLERLMNLNHGGAK